MRRTQERERERQKGQAKQKRWWWWWRQDQTTKTRRDDSGGPGDEEWTRRERGACITRVTPLLLVETTTHCIEDVGMHACMMFVVKKCRSASQTKSITPAVPKNPSHPGGGGETCCFDQNALSLSPAPAPAQVPHCIPILSAAPAQHPG